MYVQKINFTQIRGLNTEKKTVYKERPGELAFDSVSFKGIRPVKYSCIPQNIERIMQGHDIHDIYSDTLLLNPKVLKSLEKCYKKSAIDIVQEFQPYEKYFHPVELEIYKRLSKMVEIPSIAREDFRTLIKSMKPEAEKALIKTQSRVFNDILFLSNGLKPKYKTIIEAYIEKQRNLINQPAGDITFKRKRFIGDLEVLLAKVKDKKTVRVILAAASKLPTSGNDVNAFIVKYSERPSASIAQRLLTPSAASIEHIHPRSLGGENDWSNYALASVKFNSERGNSSLKSEIERNPKIPKYIQRQADELIQLANEGVITDKNYILCYRQKFLEESEGIVNIDISALEGLKTDRYGHFCVENRFSEKKYYIMSLEKDEREKEIKKMVQEKLAAQKLQEPKNQRTRPVKFESPAEIMQRKKLENQNNNFLSVAFGHIPHFNRLMVKDNRFNHPFNKRK